MIDTLQESLKYPDFFQFDLEGRGIEVKPGRFAPTYINMKATWKNPSLISKMSYELQKKCLDADCVIGIETGGSPYAVSIANNLGISLLLARKEPKRDLGILAGNLNGDYEKFAIVDDVLASGGSMKAAFESIKELGKGVICVAVISYGLDDLISKKYNIEVRTLYDVDDILNCFEKEKKKRLEAYIQDYKDKLKNKLYGK